jgi:ATP-dependent Clp protease, protease subunit
MAAKELYVYGDIWESSALDFIKSIEEAKGNAIHTRVNTPGGEPNYAYGMVTKFNEHQGAKTIIVDGKAQSSGFMFLGMAKADKIVAIKQSSFLLHRAAYAARIERDPILFTDSMKQNLKVINDGFRSAMEAKINLEAFQRITGKNMDDVFNTDTRIDIVLNAQQALEIGLIDEIVDISAKEKAEIDAMYAVAARSEFKSEDKPKQAKKMTIDQLKAEHPDIFASVFKMGEAKERDRVGAWATYAEADPEAVAKGIKDGVELTATATAELNMKLFKKQQITALADGNPPAVATTTPAVATSEDDKKAEAFFNELIK